jgi:hypothetical protein
LSALSERRMWAAIGFVALARIVVGVVLGLAPFDDTFITFRYAQNFAQGDGLVYNPGEMVLGTTTPPWALLLGALHWTGLPIAGTALVVSLVADACCLFLLAALLRRLGSPRWVALVAVLLFAVQVDAFTLARSGMESSFFIALLLGVLLSICSRRLFLAGAVAALAAMTRPEGIALVVVVAVWLLLFPQGVSRRRRLAAVGVMVGMLTAYCLCLFVVYGSIVPQSVVAKSRYAGATAVPFYVETSWFNIFAYLFVGQQGNGLLQRTPLQGNWLLLMPATAGLASIILERGVARLRHIVYLVAWPAVFVFVYATAGAFTSFPWYYASLYPFVSALAALGLQFAFGRLRTSARFVFVSTAALLGGLIVLQSMAIIEVKRPAVRRDVWVERMAQSVDGVPDSPDIRVAALEFGTIGWKLPHAQIDDLRGLVTPAVTHVTIMEYVLATNPDFVSFRVDDATAAGFMQDVRGNGDFRGGYVLTRSLDDVEGKTTYCLYERRDRPDAPTSAVRQDRSGSLAC